MAETRRGSVAAAFGGGCGLAAVLAAAAHLLSLLVAGACLDESEGALAQVGGPDVVDLVWVYAEGVGDAQVVVLGVPAPGAHGDEPVGYPPLGAFPDSAAA